MQLSTKQIMEIIPHRQPFLLLDTIEELEPGVRAVGKKCVTYNEPFCFQSVLRFCHNLL